MGYGCTQLGQIGQLGNQMFQVAGVVAKSLDTGHMACLGRWRYQEAFSLPAYYFRPPPPGIPLEDLQGYMQDYAPLKEYADSLRRWFRTSEDYSRFGYAAFRPYGDIANSLAVHIRRGDYCKYPWRFVILGSDYYRDAVEALRDQGFRWDRVLVFCDEPPPSDILMNIDSLLGVRRAIEVVKMDQRYRDLEDILTMQFMSRCGGLVIANSTFSWWSAWLSGSQYVVMPSRWGVETRPGPDGTKFQDRATDLWVPGWTRV